jgi:protein-S-isoprenylcysteine O-methyltransferase Ste14
MKKEVQKPNFLIPVINLVIMFFVMISFGLSLSISGMPIWLRLITVALQSLMIVLVVLQFIFYLKNYIDYRLNKIEFIKE